MKKLLIIIACLLLHCAAQAQSTIAGRIISGEDNLPLPGATVSVERTLATATTDSLGNFSLSGLQQGDLLQISFIGYTTKSLRLNFPVKTPLTITLLPFINQLQQVTVSTGYQTLPKERSTGSFATVDNHTFNQQVTPDILSRLPAVANGLTVDRGTNPDGQITIRGLSSIRGPKNPLIVVDNFPYEGNINNINPNDVEQVTVLKDAAAASIWGARAGNGVIVITTKKGKGNQPLTVEWNANVSVGEKPDLSYIRQMTSSDFIDVERLLFSQGYYDWQTGPTSRSAISPVVELLTQQASGSISAADANRQIDALRGIDIRDDFNRYLYRPAVNQQYALNLRGGTDKITWNASAGYDRNLSNLDALNDRKNLRFGATFNAVKNLQLSAAIYYTDGQNRSGRPGYGTVTSRGPGFYPYAKFADETGQPLPIVRDYRASYLATAGDGKLLDWRYYPLEDYKHDYTTGRMQDVLINTGLTYSLPFGLKADLKYQYERQQNPAEHLMDAQSYFARSLVNLYTVIDDNGGVTYNVPRGGVADFQQSHLSAHNFRGQINFDKSWNEHEVTAIAGTDIRDTRTTGRSFRLFGYNPENLTFSNADLTREYPTYVDGYSAFIPGSGGLSELNTRFVSYFANGAYTYKGRYTFSLSARRDASNLFGLNVNDRWNPFWSAGLGWEVSREKFMTWEALSYLRLRGTYGQSGNINPAMVAVTTIAYLGLPSPHTNLPYARFDNYANPELKWETSKMLNIGIDFRSEGDRLSGSIEYFRKKGVNLFGLSALDYTAGAGATIVRNVAGMTGNGLDIQLNSSNLKGRLSWTTTLNYSYYKEKVNDYYLGEQPASAFVSTDATAMVTGLPGYPVYAVFGYRSAGLDPQTGDPRGYLNGEISQDYDALIGPDLKVGDLRYFGSAVPTAFGSLINNFGYRRFEMSFSLSYKLGYYFHRSSINYSALADSWAGHSDYALRWQQPGDETKTQVPSLVYPISSSRSLFYAGSESMVEKGDHVRLQFVTLAYTITKDGRRSFPFRRLQVYGSASNLGILWRANKSGIDPDYNYGGFYQLVTPKIYSLGLRASL